MFFVLTAIRFQNNTVVFRGNGKDILGRSLVGTHVLLKGIVAYLPSRIVATMLLTEENWKTLYLKRDSNADYVMADEEIAQSASTPTADFSPGSDDLSSPSFIGNLLPAVSGRNQVDDLAVATDRYELREQIAGGGMGVIYSAHDRVLDREVAVKVLRPEFRSSPNHVRRFVIEAKIVSQLQHPAIPPCHDLGILCDGQPFLAMKLIKGRTLNNLLRERPALTADHGRFIAVFDQICQALAYAHSQNVIHRDRKPSATEARNQHHCSHAL